MSSPRKWLPFAVLAAALVAVPAASSPATAGQGMPATAAEANVHGVVHVVRHGLVRDCEYIQGGGFDAGLQIEGDGVNKPVYSPSGATHGRPADA